MTPYTGEHLSEMYANRHARRLAAHIDATMSLYLKPKPWYVPTWLYKKIIKESFELVTDTSRYNRSR